MGRYDQSESQVSKRSRYAAAVGRGGVRRGRRGGTDLLVGASFVALALAGVFFLAKFGGLMLDVRPWLTPALDRAFQLHGWGRGVEAKRPPAVAPPQQQPTIVEHDQPPEAVVLPALDSSDEVVRTALVAINPYLRPYLQTDQIIKRYMLVANDLSQGVRVAKHVAFLRLAEPFSVHDDGQTQVISAKSHQRYNELAKMVDAMPVEPLLDVYKKLRPLLLQVFAEFSYPHGHNLDQMFIDAAHQVLSAPVIDKPVAVVKRGAYYRFADLGLESMNGVHKQMLRMGAENTRLIQRKVRALVAGLVNPRVAPPNMGR